MTHAVWKTRMHPASTSSPKLAFAVTGAPRDPAFESLHLPDVFDIRFPPGTRELTPWLPIDPYGFAYFA